MQDFTVDNEGHPRSVGFDATDRDVGAVTVGVSLNRTQEANLLEDLYKSLHKYNYRPFKTKSRNLDLPSDAVGKLAEEYGRHIGFCIHQDTDVKLPYAEATHSAILLDDLVSNPEETIAIVDGDDRRAKQLSYASDAIGVTQPPLVNCIQSELYYPHLLLADLLAGLVADELYKNNISIDDLKQETEFCAVVDTLNGARSDYWGKGYNAAARGEGSIDAPTMEHRFADSVSERSVCWFRGQMGKKHAPPPDTDSTQSIANQLDVMGCTTAASWLEDQ